MVWPAVTRVQMYGYLSGLAAFDEIWSCSMHIAIGEGSGGYVKGNQGYADAIATPLATWYALAASGIVSTSRLVGVKVNNIAADGSYTDATTHQHTYSTPVAGGSGNGEAPAFCSLCFTWETGISRGLAHRGRIYPPNYNYVPTGSTVSSSDTAAASLAAKNLALIFPSVADAEGNFPFLQVASGVRGGARHEVTGVSVDNIYDVQRRRKNALPSVRNTRVLF